MASTPRMLLSSTCSCTCRSTVSRSGSTSARSSLSKTTTHTTTATRSASTSSTSSTHRIQPRQRWLMPDFQARKKAADLPRPKAQKFENKLNLPDGSVASIYTTSPRPNIAITKDTTNHSLWAFKSDVGGANAAGGMSQEDDGGRLGRFARKFGAAPPTAPGQEAAKSDNKAASQSPSKSSSEASAPADKKSAKKASDKKAAASPAPASSPAPAQPGKSTKEAKAAEPASASNDNSNEMDFFDLALEGEEAEVTGHKVVEDSGGKKGKKGAGKKK
ncbi:hypothetical protein P389DRAFT_166939 [Cystobasidium minutum MCA 4210]|uniref:mitochondrial 54S ribosomal bL31m domain-containing protein n=1 Tax=Cystobasidium minutum MCA 4210 TaxID=1397322 RepID=UPI0034CF30C4|eukprot:jgi/Rhomi1/166939/fgenesh1_kg.2_\